MRLPAESLSVNVVAFTVVGSNGESKVARTSVVVGALSAPLAGAVESTAGNAPSPSVTTSTK